MNSSAISILEELDFAAGLDYVAEDVKGQLVQHDRSTVQVSERDPVFPGLRLRTSAISIL